MASQLIWEKWSGEISTVSIGATQTEGGSRRSSIEIGGQKALPFLFPEGKIEHKPTIAYEVLDISDNDFKQESPLIWAEKCVNELKAELLCLKLLGAHPDFGNKSAEEEASLTKEILKAVDVPLIITGCGDDTKDNQVLPACSEAAKGQRCLIGSATQDNYKTITASVLADGHNIIAESPIDINIAKQLNILISDIGLALERIVINPTIGALGYGLEYAYSIMERARIAALSGDKTIASPFICFAGQEAWRAKEAKTGSVEQGIIWEIVTSVALIQAGADILVMRHPVAIEKVNSYINNLMVRL
jgi:acetyl-CoA decarbonylase/synthase complex subunit delta